MLNLEQVAAEPTPVLVTLLKIRDVGRSVEPYAAWLVLINYEVAAEFAPLSLVKDSFSAVSQNITVIVSGKSQTTYLHGILTRCSAQPYRPETPLLRSSQL